MAQSYIWIRALVVVTILLFLVKMLLADQIDPFGHRDHSAPMQVQSQLQSQHSFPSNAAFFSFNFNAAFFSFNFNAAFFSFNC